MLNKNYSTNLTSYNEAEALQQLLQAYCKVADEQNAVMEATDCVAIREFTITVGGIQTAFMLGGPQMSAIDEFIKHIAAENFYEVDFDNLTVSG